MRGITLLELILSVLILSLVGVSVTLIYVRTSDMMEEPGPFPDPVDDARFAFDLMERDAEGCRPTLDAGLWTFGRCASKSRSWSRAVPKP